MTDNIAGYEVNFRDRLGRGAIGLVYKAKDKNGITIAAKQVDTTRSTGLHIQKAYTSLGTSCPNRNFSQVGCFIKVSRKTRRVSKVNKGGQLQEFSKSRIGGILGVTDRYQSFCTTKKTTF